jgi:hypothetical protein
LKNFSDNGNQEGLHKDADQLTLQIPMIVDTSQGLASHSGNKSAKKLQKNRKNPKNWKKNPKKRKKPEKPGKTLKTK